jgi:hypothetical protein
MMCVFPELGGADDDFSGRVHGRDADDACLQINHDQSRSGIEFCNGHGFLSFEDVQMTRLLNLYATFDCSPMGLESIFQVAWALQPRQAIGDLGPSIFPEITKQFQGTLSRLANKGVTGWNLRPLHGVYVK